MDVPTSPPIHFILSFSETKTYTHRVPLLLSNINLLVNTIVILSEIQFTNIPFSSQLNSLGKKW